jgi:hypothetical protein
MLVPEPPDDLEAFTEAQRDALLAMTPEEVGRWLGFSEQGGAMIQETQREVRGSTLDQGKTRE